MKKENLRLVEYITSNHEYRKGLFHLWKKNILENGSEHYTGLIEGLSTGTMIEDDYSTIRFLNPKEMLDFLPENPLNITNEKENIDEDMLPITDKDGNYLDLDGNIIGNVNDTI